MRKEEFVNQLRIDLSVAMSGQVVSEHIRYYQEYIELEIRKGRLEEEVILELGNPRLLAKSIIEANKHKSDSESVDYEMERDASNQYKKNTDSRKFIKLKGLIAVVVMIGVLILIARLFIYALPFIVIGIAVTQLVRFLSSRR